MLSGNSPKTFTVCFIKIVIVLFVRLVHANSLKVEKHLSSDNCDTIFMFLLFNMFSMQIHVYTYLFVYFTKSNHTVFRFVFCAYSQNV